MTDHATWKPQIYLAINKKKKKNNRKSLRVIIKKSKSTIQLLNPDKALLTMHKYNFRFLCVLCI